MSWTPSRDPDGDFILRSKVTKPGWTYDQRVIEFTTSKLDSASSNRFDGADWGDFSLKYYDVDGAELIAPTQAVLDSSCKATALSWEPTYQYDLFGGELSILSLPAGYEDRFDAKVWIVGVPFLPYPIGEVEMVGGRTLKGAGTVISVDGRTGKGMVPDPTYHTNELLTYIEQGSVGEQFRLEMVFEHYFERS